MSMQQRLFCGIILGLSTSAMAVGPAGVDSFGAIENWTGTGANQAALVLDWHNGQTNSAMAWGVRFDAPITADTAIRQILAADSRLYGAANGTFWMAFGYDADSAGAQGATIPAGAANPYTPTNGVISYTEAWSMPGSAPLDSNDYYGSDDGVASTSWGLYVPDTTIYDDNGTPTNYWDDTGAVGVSASYTGITFASATVGGSALTLQDGSWMVSSFGSYDVSWTHQAPPSANAPMAAPASVPEPLTMSLLAMGGLGLLRRRKK